jgi:RNA polymerase sigma factor (sigma-70 family)
MGDHAVADAAATLTSGGVPALEELDDNQLIAMSRQGSTEAYGVLFTRYSYAGRRLARHLGQGEDSDDVVSEAFAQVLDLLRRGKGPDRAFRAYLFTTIRHESGRRAKARQRVMPTDDDAKIDTAVPFGDGQLDQFEKTAVRAAYESLPDRWRTVLWHLDVEGRKPHELGPLMDLSPNSVSALVYRARAGLREAYLAQHVNVRATDTAADCQQVRAQLAAYVRGTSTAREKVRVTTHLGTCAECVRVEADLRHVNLQVG